MGILLTDPPPVGEFPSGLDLAELVTKQWDCVELSSRREATELADRS